jgi:beta-glucosidase
VLRRPGDASAPSPPKELKAFAEVWLDPGESTTVQLKLEERDFAYWDPGKPDYAALEERLRGSMWEGQAEPGWRVDPGRYGLHVGRSSADIAHVAHVTLD